jgi:hypothetical protein
MPTIPISFDTYKHLMFRRRDEDHSIEAVIREALGLPVAVPAAPVQGKSWVQDNVELVPGTQLRALYRGKPYDAVINDNGEMIFDGKVMTSLSAAAHAVTGNSVNGWGFWQAKRPDDSGFASMAGLRTLAQL